MANGGACAQLRALNAAGANVSYNNTFSATHGLFGNHNLLVHLHCCGSTNARESEILLRSSEYTQQKDNQFYSKSSV